MQTYFISIHTEEINILRDFNSQCQTLLVHQLHSHIVRTCIIDEGYSDLLQLHKKKGILISVCRITAQTVVVQVFILSYQIFIFIRHYWSTEWPNIMFISCKTSFLNPTESVALLTLVPEFSFFLLELSAQSLISITVWIMNDHRALYKGLCYSCTVLLNRKLFCMPSWRKGVADCFKSHYYLG